LKRHLDGTGVRKVIVDPRLPSGDLHWIIANNPDDVPLEGRRNSLDHNGGYAGQLIRNMVSRVDQTVHFVEVRLGKLKDRLLSLHGQIGRHVVADHDLDLVFRHSHWREVNRRLYVVSVDVLDDQLRDLSSRDVTKHQESPPRAHHRPRKIRAIHARDHLRAVIR
jgi:hypothetical protein